MPNVTVIQPTKHEAAEKIRCAAYCRVSSNSEDQLNSYAAQIKHYSTILNSSQNEELVDIYADEGITGTSAEKRAEFQRMLSDCRKGKIDRIYTKSISRFARNYKDSLEAVRELRSLGISVYFEEQNIDTLKTNDEMIIVVLSNLAQQESVSISQNMRWSISRRMKNGTYELSTPPYGYRKENGKLIIEPSEAETVRDIFGWYLAGIGITSIAQMLNKMKVPTGNGGAKWHNSPVRYILTNEKYVGDTLLQKTYSSDTLPFRTYKNKGEKDQYLVMDSHEPLISKMEFDRVQAMMKERGTLYYKENGEASPFHKKIKCAECGRTYIKKVVRNKVYWVCATHDLDAKACGSGRIRQQTIEESFQRMIRKLKTNYTNILIPLRKSLQELKIKSLGADEKLLDVHNEIAKMREQQAVIAGLHTKGFLSEDKYLQQTSDLNAKIKRMKKKLKQFDKAYDDDESLNALDDFIEIVESQPAQITDFDDDVFTDIVIEIVAENNSLMFITKCGLRFREKI